ncbi:uncharacterized protein LOC131934707 [Physella acuta]|uniref:uncharacterized protein LOC131934707 n=1 Tax=Physella acuta TaxID=109671 RepID=UPI0027DE016F|nr:uncharacterized protein LOC131934707 [Physella acuta]
MASTIRSSFRHEGHMFFIYNHKKKTEEDDPKDAILYFYPRTIEVNDRIALVGGIIGLADFCLEFMPQCIPSIVKLSGHTFALLQHEEFIIGLTGSPDLPDKFLISHMQFVWSTFVFYQGSLEAIRERVSDANFLKELDRVWDMYLPLCQIQGDSLSQAFQVLPYVQLHKSQGSLFLHASHILQRALRHKGVIAGALFNRNKVLCSQLNNNLTRQLLLLMSHSQFPCVEANSILELPGGVRLLYVYLPQEEFASLGHRRKKAYIFSSSQKGNNDETTQSEFQPGKNNESFSFLQGHRYPRVKTSDGGTSSGAELGETHSSDASPLLKHRSTSLPVSPTATVTSGTDSEVFLDTLSELNFETNQKLGDIKELVCTPNKCSSPMVADNSTSMSSPVEESQSSAHLESHSHIFTGSPGESSKSTEESIKTTGESTKTTEESSKTTEESSKTTEESTKSAEENSDTVEKSSKAVESQLTDPNCTINSTMSSVEKNGLDTELVSINSLSKTDSLLPIEGDVTAQKEPVQQTSANILPDLHQLVGQDQSVLKHENIADKTDNVPIDSNTNGCSPNSIDTVDAVLTCEIELSALNSLGPSSVSSISVREPSNAYNSIFNLERNKNIATCPTSMEAFVATDLNNETVFERIEELTDVKKIVSSTSSLKTSSFDSESERTSSGSQGKDNCKNTSDRNKENVNTSLYAGFSGDESSAQSSSDVKQDPEGSQLSLICDLSLNKDRLTFVAVDSENSDYGITSRLSEMSPISPTAEHSGRSLEINQQSGSEEVEFSSHSTPSATAGLGLNLSSEVKSTSEASDFKHSNSSETKWSLRNNGLQEVTLYAQGHSDTLLVLLLSRNLKCGKSYISSLWKSCLSHLAELDFEVKDAERHVKDDNENVGSTFQYIRYDSFTQSLKGSALLPVTSLANEIVDTSVKMHECFMNSPDLQEVTYRSHSSSCFGRRTVNTETYFQLPLPRSAGGICSPEDSTFMLDQNAERFFLKEAKI